MCITMMSKPGFPVARLLVSVVAAAITSGCAMKRDVRDLQAEIQALAARQDSLLEELRLEARSTQDTIRTQSDQMVDFRGDISQQLRAIRQSLSTLEALAGENQRAIAGVRDQLASQRRTSAGPTPPPVVTDSAGAAVGGGERLIRSGGGTPDQLWNAAMVQYDRGSLNAASTAFEQFLAEYPDHPRAADAHFFLADILTQQNRPEDALAAFEEIQQLFPTAPKVPDALYRIAVLQDELGDTQAARATLERIMNTYPDAPISMLARDMRRRIG
jgi:tol-pal system protein YbgF